MHAMSVFKLPQTFLAELESLMTNFLWGQKDKERKVHWISWNRMCIPKSHEGLGFKKLNTFNLSLLTKQRWPIHQQEDSLLHRLYTARYFPDTTFFDLHLGPNPSFVWHEIGKQEDGWKKVVCGALGMERW